MGSNKLTVPHREKVAVSRGIVLIFQLQWYMNNMRTLPLTILQALSHKTFMIDAFDRREAAGARSPDPRASI